MEQNIILYLAVLILIADVWLACCDKARHEEATWMEYSDDIVVQKKDIRRIGNCGGTWTSNSGAITSPSYPNHYGILEDCIYNITVSRGYFVELTFTSFQTEACCDTVNVYDGDKITDPLLGSFSGESIPNTVTSSGPMLLIHFESDSSFNAYGYYVVYDTKTNLDGPPSYKVCDDVNVHGLGGLIYSHKDYPAGSPKLSFCVLTIFANPVYKKIYLKFLEVDLYNPYNAGCGSFDVIRVSNGDDEKLGTICQDGDTDVYSTASGSMVITFTTETQALDSDARGFKAIFTAFYDTTYSWEDCRIDTDFHCDNGRCISGKLRCDDYDNCGDNSDEENCFLASVVGTSIGIIVVLVIIIIIIVCICTRACSSTPAGRRRGRPKRATTEPPPVNYSQGQVNVTPRPPQTANYGNDPPYPTDIQQNRAGYWQPAGYNPVMVPGPTYPQGPQQTQLYSTDQPYPTPTPMQGATDPAYPPSPAAYAPAFPQQSAPEALPPPSVPPPSYEEVTSVRHCDSQ